MANAVTHVKNPLTVIAIFAGLAEVSGTAVLPLLKEDTQAIYVWFLMLFPCLLVTLFFAILYFRHHVLYAPSDYRDEKIFANLFVSGSTSQRLEKLADEAIDVAEIDIHLADVAMPGEAEPGPPAAEEQGDGEPGADETERFVPTRESPEHLRRAEFLAKAALAEDLVVSRLGSELGVSFTRDVRRSGSGGVLVDAFSIDPARPIAIETKFLTRTRALHRVINSGISTIIHFAAQLPPEIQGRFEGIVAIVTDGIDDIEMHFVEAKAKEWASNYARSVQVKVYRLADLEKSLESNVSTEWWRRTFGPTGD